MSDPRSTILFSIPFHNLKQDTSSDANQIQETCIVNFQSHQYFKNKTKRSTIAEHSLKYEKNAKLQVGFFLEQITRQITVPMKKTSSKVAHKSFRLNQIGCLCLNAFWDFEVLDASLYNM
jgi:hypothetical protein